MKENKVFIIAEAGVNHNGSLDLAFKLVDAAVVAGADAVKFQTFRANSLVVQNAPKANYQLQTTADTESQYEMLKKLELTEDDHKKIIKYCRSKKIEFLSSAFDIEGINLLRELGLNIFKIPSGEAVNPPHLRRVAEVADEIIISTGMCTMDEVEQALKILMDQGFDKNKITVLHCNTEYPTLYEDVNLMAMISMRDKFGVRVGYSDHTSGIEVPIAAVAMGATVIEKHFTLDRNMDGPDHQASLEPHELQAMVGAIRNIEIALGDGVKKMSSSEMKNIFIARKSIVAAVEIRKGEILTEKNITVKRPGNGMSPMMWDEIIGKVTNRDYRKDELIIL